MTTETTEKLIVSTTAVQHYGPIGLFVEYEKAKEEVLKTVPKAHNRIIRTKTEEEYKARVLASCYGEDEAKVGDHVYYVHNENLGNKKYPEIIESIEWGMIKSIGPKQVILDNGDRPLRNSIIALERFA